MAAGHLAATVTGTSVSRCEGCGADLIGVREIPTGLTMWLDVEKAHGGDVVVYAIGGHASCRRLPVPPFKPAWREHTCLATTPAAGPTVDPYEDEDPGIEQARWRRP